MRAWALALLVLLSGCAGSSTTNLGPASFDEAAVLRGVVTDEELRPVPAAQVVLAEDGRSTTTDEAGRFELAAVPPGQWTLSVQAEGHAPRNETLVVEGAEVVDVQLQIERLGVVRPYRLGSVFKGHYDCAHEIPIWTGDCMILYKSATGQNDTQTAETFHFRLPVQAGWESVVLELAWTQGPNNQLDGMRVYLENGNGTDIGHSYKVGRAEGPENPLRLVVHRGTPHPRADTYTGTETKAFIPDGGETAQVRVFPRGKLYDQTSQVCDGDGKCFLGVGAGLSIDFTVYATVFYHERAPDAFSAMPDQ